MTSFFTLFKNQIFPSISNIGQHLSWGHCQRSFLFCAPYTGSHKPWTTGNAIHSTRWLGNKKRRTPLPPTGIFYIIRQLLLVALVRESWIVKLWVEVTSENPQLNKCKIQLRVLMSLPIKWNNDKFYLVASKFMLGNLSTKLARLFHLVTTQAVQIQKKLWSLCHT